MELAWEAIARRVSAWNRTRKWRLFLHRFGPSSATTILDVGYQDRELQPADNFLEKHYPWSGRITALGIVTPVEFSQRYPEVKVVVYDGDVFPFEDDSFDIVWSNAVLEHVGDRERQLAFLRECSRVGKSLFLTTPNRHFPIEVHTRLPLVHWLPKPAFDWILHRIGKGDFSDDYMWLLSHRQLRSLLAEAGLDATVIVRNRLIGPTLDFVVVRP